MPNNNPSNQTGAKQLAGAAASGAANLAGPALQLASGAGVLRTAADTIKGAALDKLLGPTALFAGGLVGALRTIKAIVDQSGILERGLNRIASIQQISGQFETLLKSAEAAQKRLKELYQFTAKSPFDFREVAEANRVLEALTKGALSGAKGMEMVGDAAAATGQSFSETAERIGKVYNALKSGRSIDKVMFQLQMTGVVTDDLARKLETAEQSGASFGEMWGMVEQQLKSTSGGMKNEMQNLDALNQRLKNASALMETAFGQPFVEAQAAAIENTVKATQNLTPLLGKIGADLAPILQFTTLIRGKVYDWVFATKSFADALTIAWGVAKAFAVAIGGTALASMAGNIGATAKSLVGFASTLRDAAQAQQLIGPPVALFLHAEAAKAAAAGNLLNAASLKAQAFWSTASSAAVRLHSAALVTATAAGRGFNLVTYLSAIAAGTATGAIALLGRAVTAATRGLVGFATANPILVAGTAALAAAEAFRQWADAVAKTNQEYIDLVQTSAKATRALREQVDAVRNLDQYRKALADSSKEETETVAAIRGLGAAPGATFQNPDGFGGSDAVANPAYANFRETKSVLETKLMKIRRERERLKGKDINGLGLSNEEQSAAVESAEREARLRDAREQAEIERADDAGRERLLRARAGRLGSEADAGELIAKGRLRPEAFTGNPTALMQVAKQIGDLETAGKNVPGSLLQKRADLAASGNTYQEKRAQALQDVDEANRLREGLRIKQAELAYDNLIADVRKQGGETGRIEAAKELSIMREQLRIAEEKGEAGKFEAAQIRARIRLTEADKAKARGDIAVERAGNNAILNRNPEAAQALQDAAELSKLRDQYEKIGLTSGQADSDFAQRIRAGAMQAAPRLVADSLQRVGGGGGSAGSDPMLAAQMRIEKYNAAMVKYLEIISKGAGGTMK